MLTRSSTVLDRIQTSYAHTLPMFLADFHVHSTFSDGKMPLPQLIDLYGKNGFGAIAVTDHLCENQTVIGRASAYLGCSLTPATFPIYLEMLKSEAERAWDQYGMVVLPGFELSKNSVLNHRSAHVLGIGVSEFVWADAEVSVLARQIRSKGGIAVAAHPVWTRKIEKQTYFLWDNRDELSEAFDAWEVASGPFIFDEVAKSKLPKIASSDLHVEKQITSWKTVLHCERKPEAILDAIRNQELGYHFYEVKGESRDHSRYSSNSPVGCGPRHDALGNLARAEAF